jgi:hypothetical protein
MGAAVRADRFAVRRQNGRIPAPRTFDAVCDAIAQARQPKAQTISPAQVRVSLRRKSQDNEFFYGQKR